MEYLEVLDKKITFSIKNGLIHFFQSQLYVRNLNKFFKLSFAGNSNEVIYAHKNEIETIIDYSKKQSYKQFLIYTLYINNDIDFDTLSLILVKGSVIYNLVELNYSIKDKNDYFFLDLVENLKNYKNIRLIIHIDSSLVGQYEISKYAQICFIIYTSNLAFENEYNSPNIFVNYNISSTNIMMLINKKNSFLFNFSFNDIDHNSIRSIVQDTKRIEYIKILFGYLRFNGSIINETGFVDKEKGVASYDNNICNTCWAKNMCWSNKFYWMFFNSPLDTIKNNKNCEVIRTMIEFCIENIGINSKYNKNIFEKENIIVNDFNIKLINP